MNTFTFDGHLGGDPEVKQVGDYDVVEFSVANTQYEGKEKDSTTGWYRCQVWQKGLGDYVTRYAEKGSLVLVTGELKQQHYTSRDNGEKIAMVVRVDRIRVLPRAATTDEDRPRSNSSNSSNARNSRDNSRDDRPRRDDRSDRRPRDDDRDERPRRDDRSDRRTAAPPRRTRDEDYDDDRPARKSTASPRAAAPPEEEEDDVPFK